MKKIIQSQKLSLPIKHNPNLDKIAQIDFDFMEYFIAELEAYRIAELEAYLIATGLSNYTLTKKEQKILDEFNENVVGGGVSD